MANHNPTVIIAYSCIIVSIVNIKSFIVNSACLENFPFDWCYIYPHMLCLQNLWFVNLCHFKNYQHYYNEMVVVSSGKSSSASKPNNTGSPSGSQLARLLCSKVTDPRSVLKCLNYCVKRSKQSIGQVSLFWQKIRNRTLFQQQMRILTVFCPQIRILNVIVH